MESGQSRGKFFLIIGGLLIAIIIIVTALRNRDPKPTDTDKPTLFEGIRNLTKTSVDSVTEYLGEQTRKIIPLQLKDLNNDSQGIPNVLKLSTTKSVGIALPEESYAAASPNLPQILPFPRIITQNDGTLKRISLLKEKPIETLYAAGATTELFDASFGNNLQTLVARARTLTTLTHYVGYLSKNTANYCPYSITLNKKNTYTPDELAQIYGLLQVNSVIPASYPPFTDYKTNVQSLIQVYQTKNTLSKKPTGILDQGTINLLSVNCSNITKEEKRAAGEEIPEYLLSYKQQVAGIQDFLISPTTPKGLVSLDTGDGITIGQIPDITTASAYTPLFNSPFSDFNIEAPNTTTLIITARPASGYDGVAYKIDIPTGKRTTLLENVQGLMTLVSPDAQFTLFSDSADTQDLYMFNNTSFEATKIPFTTLPDKCAWTQNSQSVICGVPVDGGISPDDWLKGYTTNDEIKAYTISNNRVTDLPQPTEEVDVFKGTVSSENRYFGFINRKTMEPWMVSLVDFLK